MPKIGSAKTAIYGLSQLNVNGLNGELELRAIRLSLLSKQERNVEKSICFT